MEKYDSFLMYLGGLRLICLSVFTFNPCEENNCKYYFLVFNEMV